MTLRSLLSCGLIPLLATASPALAFDPIITIGGKAMVIHPGGGTFEVLATKEQSGGEFGVITTSDTEPGNGPGRIIQGNNVEMWYVLEGTYDFTLGDKTFEGGPGTFVAVDAGQPHEFKGKKTPGKLLMLYTPGGFEHFFMDWEKQGIAFGPDLGKLEASYGVTRP